VRSALSVTGEKSKQGNSNVTKPQVGWTNVGLASVFASQSTLDDARTSSTPDARSKPNAGAIAGGVVVALAAVALAAGAFLFYRRYKHTKWQMVIKANQYQKNQQCTTNTSWEAIL
jgi:hypothetical protein